MSRIAALSTHELTLGDSGLFVGSGGALANGGPLGMFLGYTIMGSIVYAMMVAVRFPLPSESSAVAYHATDSSARWSRSTPSPAHSPTTLVASLTLPSALVRSLPFEVEHELTGEAAVGWNYWYAQRTVPSI